MSNRNKRVSQKKRWCSVHGPFNGYQWGGHRKKCKELEAEPPKKGDTTKLMKQPEKPKTTVADQVVRTVRSYLAGIDEEYLKNEAALKDLGERTGILLKRQVEIKAERNKIVSSLKELK